MYESGRYAEPEMETSGSGNSRPSLLSLEPLDGLLEQSHVGVDADGVCESGLLTAEQISGSPQLHVPESHGISASQFCMVFQHSEAALGLITELGGRNQIAESPAAGPPHPATDLVELRQSETVGPVHDKGVRVRDIEAVFDD